MGDGIHPSSRHCHLRLWSGSRRRRIRAFDSGDQRRSRIDAPCSRCSLWSYHRYRRIKHEGAATVPRRPVLIDHIGMNRTADDGTNRPEFVRFRFYRRGAAKRVRRMSRNRIGDKACQNQHENRQFLQKLSHWYPGLTMVEDEFGHFRQMCRRRTRSSCRPPYDKGYGNETASARDCRHRKRSGHLPLAARAPCREPRREIHFH